MIIGATGVQFLLLSVLFVLAFRYELEMPLSITLLLAVPTVGLGGAIAYLFRVLFTVPAWYPIGIMSAACLGLIAWSEVRSSSPSF